MAKRNPNCHYPNILLAKEQLEDFNKITKRTYLTLKIPQSIKKTHLRLSKKWLTRTKPICKSTIYNRKAIKAICIYTPSIKKIHIGPSKRKWIKVPERRCNQNSEAVMNLVLGEFLLLTLIPKIIINFNLFE